jgi:hypothetical protein
MRVNSPPWLGTTLAGGGGAEGRAGVLGRCSAGIAVFGTGGAAGGGAGLSNGGRFAGIVKILVKSPFFAAGFGSSTGAAGAFGGSGAAAGAAPARKISSKSSLRAAGAATSGGVGAATGAGGAGVSIWKML